MTSTVDQERQRPGRIIKYARASDIRTQAVDWLLDCWIPQGAVTLLAGREGIGKSTIAVDWATQVTTGQLTGRAQNVAYVVSEDSKEHTVVPRLKAAGADLRRIMFPEVEFPDPDTGDIYRRTLDLPGDTNMLEQFITEQHVGLVILDAAKSVMSSKLKGNDDMDIRRFLEPLARIAEATGTTFICLVHLSAKKISADTGNLIMGSSAWSQVARSVVTVAADKDAGTVKIWNSKANLAPRIRTMEAQVVSATVRTDDDQDTEVGKIHWLGECDTDGTDLLSSDGDREERDNRTEVEMWLTDYLAGHGEHPKKDVLTAAQKAGFPVRKTVERAFAKIGGISQSGGFPRTAHWSLPGVPTGGVAQEGVPTVPTGADQGKHDVPTGENDTPHVPTGVPTVLTSANTPSSTPEAPSWDTSATSPPDAVPTGSETLQQAPAPTATPTDEARSIILDTLDDTGAHGVGQGVLVRMVKETTGDGSQAFAILDGMVSGGVLRQDDGRYYRKDPA